MNNDDDDDDDDENAYGQHLQMKTQSFAPYSTYSSLIINYKN